MKRFLLAFSAVALLWSCTEIDDFDQSNKIQNAEETLSLYAAIADDDTRTYVENDKDVLWHNGDWISVFYANRRNDRFEYLGESGAREAKFDLASKGFINNSMSLKTHALYPFFVAAQTAYDEATDSFNITTKLRDIQPYIPNSFGREANQMVAVSADSSEGLTSDVLYFRNACGFLTLKLYGENVAVKSIKLIARGGELLSGNANIRAHANEAPVLTMTNGSDAVTLVAGESGVALGATKESATEFWFALPPQTLASGIKIEVTDVNGCVYIKETTKPIVIERNQIQPMAALKYVYSQMFYTRHADSTEPIDMGTGEERFDAKISANYYDSVNKRFVVEFATPMTTIKKWAFSSSKEDWKSIILPNTLTTIANEAFRASAIAEIVFPGSVTFIEYDAFKYSQNLQSVIFEPSPTNTPLRIGYLDSAGDAMGPFTGARLEYIYVNRDFVYVDEYNELFEPDDILEGIFACSDYQNTVKVVIGEQLPVIYDHMFASLAIEEIIIPDHITYIGTGAFRECEALTSITIPSSVEYIGEWAFYHCIGLNSVYIEDSSKQLNVGYSYEEYSPFFLSPLNSVYMGRDIVQIDADGNRCDADSWKSGIFVTKLYDDEDATVNVTIGPEVTAIPNHMLNYMPITSITIPESVKSIGKLAFRSCKKLTDITIPASVETIGEDVFYDCTALSTLRIEDSDTALKIGYTYEGSDEYGPFYDSPLTDIYFGRDIIQVDDDGEPSVADSWEEGVFTNKGKKEVSLNIGPKVTAITDYMFSQLHVKSVYLYPAIKSIGAYAFNDCSIFQGLSCHHIDPPTLGENAFDDCSEMWYIRIPEDAMTNFKSANGWKEFDRNNKYNKNFYYTQE